MSETLQRVAVKLEVNGEPRTITVEPRTTLLDALREQLCDDSGYDCIRIILTPGAVGRALGLGRAGAVLACLTRESHSTCDRLAGYTDCSVLRRYSRHRE
jgi:hypothetical protein